MIPLRFASNPPHRRRKLFVFAAAIMTVLALGGVSAFNTRRMQNRMKCLERMTRIGQALLTYQSEFDVVMPTMDRLIAMGAISEAQTVCPAAKPGVSEYVLLPRILPAGSTRKVLVYEDLSNHGNGMNVFFDDGRCQFVPKKRLQELGLDNMPSE